MASKIIVRDYDDADWPLVWPVIEEVVRAGDTFPFPTDLTEEEARGIWLENGPGGRVTVAVDGDRLLGTAKMGRNRPGPGSHVATASYMVTAEARGLRCRPGARRRLARLGPRVRLCRNAVQCRRRDEHRRGPALREPRLHRRGHRAAAHELPTGERVGLRIMHVDL